MDDLNGRCDAVFEAYNSKVIKINPFLPVD
jgi:hypothetical protein